MVATSGRGWTLPPSLRALVLEANAIAPGRSKASDGSIGDAAHAARASDHNPRNGFVHAVDLTHSPGRGFDVHARLRDIASRKDPRAQLLISNGEYWTQSSGIWRKYKGSNPHTSHGHVSIFYTSSARNNVSPWFSGAVVTLPEVGNDLIKSSWTNESGTDEEEMEMKLFRDHHGRIWLWYPDGTRKYIPDAGRQSVWQNNFQLPMVDLGPGSPFRNDIVSAVWLEYVREVV